MRLYNERLRRHREGGEGRKLWTSKTTILALVLLATFMLFGIRMFGFGCSLSLTLTLLRDRATRRRSFGTPTTVRREVPRRRNNAACGMLPHGQTVPLLSITSVTEPNRDELERSMQTYAEVMRIVEKKKLFT